MTANSRFSTESRERSASRFPISPDGRHGEGRKRGLCQRPRRLGESVRAARMDGAAPKPRPIEELRRDPDVIETLAEGGAFIAVPLRH